MSSISNSSSPPIDSENTIAKESACESHAKRFAENLNDIRANRSAIRKTHLKAVGIFILLSAACAGIVTAIITFKVTLITTISGTIASVALAIAFFMLGKWQQEKVNGFTRIFDVEVEQLIYDHEDTQTLLKILKTFGKYCTFLNLSDKFETAYDLKSFLEEEIIQHSHNPQFKEIVTKYVCENIHILETTMVSIYNDFFNTFSNAIREFKNKASLEAKDIEAINKLLNSFLTSMSEHNGKLCNPQLRLIKDKELAQIIRACPNLSELRLGFCISTEVIKACIAIGVPTLVHKDLGKQGNQQLANSFSGTSTTLYYN